MTTALFFSFLIDHNRGRRPPPPLDATTTTRLLLLLKPLFLTTMMMMMMDERIPCVRLLLLAVVGLCAFLPEENVVLATASGANTNYNGESDKNNEQLWCEPDNCYDVLEVHQHNATKATIKKQYFKFSRMYHPDKIGVNAAATASEEEGKKKKKGNDDDDDDDERKEMTAKFAKLARAYEILSDERRRRDYDYALKYPEDKERNRAMFYRDKYSNQGILRARFTYIFIGIAIVVTLFQFFNDRSVYRNVWLDFKASDVYAREMKTRLKKVNEKRMMANVVGSAGKKKGSSSNGGLKGAGGSSSSISSMNREDSSSSLNATTTGGNNKAYASKREKKKFLRNRSKEEEERDILDIEDEMRAQLVEQGVLSTPTWRNLAIVIVSKWAVKKAREIGAKAKAKARDIAREAKKKK